MRVLLCVTKATKRANWLLDTFGSGVATHGDAVGWCNSIGNVEQAVRGHDVAVQVCTANRWHGNHGGTARFRRRLLDSCIAHGRRLVTIDTGYLSNQTEAEFTRDAASGSHRASFDADKTSTYAETMGSIYYEVGFDGLKRDSDYYAEGKGPERFAELGVELAPWRETNDGPIVVLGQTNHGASTVPWGRELWDWYSAVLPIVRKATDRPIVWRMHPRTYKRPERRRAERKRVQSLYGKFGVEVRDEWILSNDLRKAWATIVMSSNAGVRSVVEGVPAFVGFAICQAWPVRAGRFEDIERPVMHDRRQWANEIAWCQWNGVEMSDGTCWSHLRPHALEEPTFNQRARK